MAKIRVNYKSDLPPIAVKFKINGTVVDVPDHNFAIRFFVDGSPGTSFVCSYKDGEFVNCAKTSTDTLMCYIDNHNFGCGRLCCEFIDLSADSRYKDKVLKTVTPSCLNVALVEGAGDSGVEVLNVVFGYEINEIDNISVQESQEDGGINVVTITETNGQVVNFNVKNGTKGSTGVGKSAYQSYVETTADVPVKTESEWIDSLHGANGVHEDDVTIADNLTTDDPLQVLSAKQGKVLNDKLYTTVESQGEQTTFNGNNAERTANKGIINDGSDTSASNRAITPFLEIYPLSTVTYLGFSSSDTYGIAFYDEDKNFIVGSWHNIPNDRSQTFTAPEGACFVRGTIIGGTSSSYVKYYPIVRTPVEAIPQLDERVTALEEGGAISVIDNLESSSTTDPLSANQGRVIGGCIYNERGATSQTTIGQADATHSNYGIGSDGRPSNSGNLAYSKYTDFTKIAGGSTYKYSSYAPTIGGLAFYAEANEASFISFVASPAGGGAKSGYVPNNAKYFRVTFTAGSSSDYFKYYAMQSVPVNQAVDEAMDATQPFIGKRIAILGDSITWLSMSSDANRGWVTHFRELLKFAELRNYARSGATWSHTASTQYDITEDTTSISNDNVIYNQVNRLINDVENNGVTAPDYIFILAGTNDAWYPSQRPDAVADTPASVMSDESVWLNVKSIGSLTSIPKAMRYVAEMIWDKFPDAQVVVTTPLQSTAFTTDRREAIAESIKGSAEYLSWAVIEQDKVCDISRIREHQGYYMTYDGTHTSAKGAQMVGGIFASLLKALFKK